MRASPNVVLHVGELAYGDGPFEVTGDGLNDVRLRTSHVLWHKENILNLVVRRILQLTGNQPRLRDQIRAYFRSRSRSATGPCQVSQAAPASTCVL